MRASTTAQMKSRMKSWTSAKLPWCYRSVTINRIYFLHLTCCRASVLWYLSRPPTADKERLGCFHHAVDAGDLQVLHPHVGDGHQCWALLWCKELAASMAPCCENIPHRSIGSQMVHSLCPPVSPELQLGSRKVSGISQKMQNAAGHQKEGPSAIMYKSACYQGALESTKAVCSAAELALG